MPAPELPIESILPGLREALRAGRSIVVQAPPGAGKTTRVPLAVLDADLGLALSIEAQRYLREDLRLIVMSATLDGARVATLLGDAPVIVSEGRSFPVETRYLTRPASERLEDRVVAGIRRAIAEESGSLLVFLPGVGEIRRVERMLGEIGLGAEIRIAPLYGGRPPAAQDAALLPAPPGAGKIVLATAIAATSLTS